MSIIIAADHRGFELKEYLKKYYEFIDVTPRFKAGDDYPDVAKKLLNKIKKDDKGILVCGSGTGVAMAANRSKKSRAVNAPDARHARMARKHEDVNILCIGANFIGKKESRNIIDTFLKTKFLGGRYLRRLNKL